VDPEGGNQCCESGVCRGDSRIDTGGGIWFAGDYTDKHVEHMGMKASNIRIQQGMFYNMAGLDRNSRGCKVLGTTSAEVSGAKRQEAYIQKDVTLEPFALRRPFSPVFCWEQSWLFGPVR
jgi:hypothetical protein